MRIPALFMTSRVMLTVLGAMALAVLPPASRATDTDAARERTAANEGSLTVHVEGLQSSEGKLRLVMFDSEENFLKNAVRAEVIEIQDRRGTWLVENLPYGVYAVLVHHDVDGSGAMERHWFGKPREPTGASNDAPSRFGPPKYKKARFSFDSPRQTITITIR